MIESKKPSILFVVQRYGEDVNGGAETLCREVAEHLVDDADIEVATSCAKHYTLRFENDYPVGTIELNGVTVNRFPLSRLRSEAEVFSALDQKVIARKATEKEELNWLQEIGPFSDELNHFVLDNAYRFELIVYVTYLYAPTTLLLSKTRHKAVLVPNAHDEDPLKAKYFDNFFSIPRFIACNARPELELLKRRSVGQIAEAEVVAMGFDTPVFQPALSVALPDRFILYAGRIQSEKGCDELFRFYLNLPASLREALPLVLIGSAAMDIPNDISVVYRGFVSEDEKYTLMQKAAAVIVPSKQESLSIVLMESWLCGTPVVVNAHSDVLLDHVQTSAGGFSYHDEPTFVDAIRALEEAGIEKLAELAELGRQYVSSNYSWAAVTAKYMSFVEAIEPRKRRKVCFVVQRFGDDVNGGAEQLCRKIAVRMNLYHDVTVVTSCARDYGTWENYYDEGEDQVDGVKVLRFAVDEPRNQNEFDQLSERVAARNDLTREEADVWVKAQGPYSTSLLDYLENSADDYDCFIFFTYLYATTYFGIQRVGKKCLLAPFVHDEWMLNLGIWQDVFESPQSIIYSTPAERRFLQRKFPGSNLQGPVVGVAVERPDDIDPRDFREKFSIQEDFILYVGRIDESKGCKDLFEMYLKYKEQVPSCPKLVLMGNAVIDIPEDESIKYLGFVSEADKWNALAACNLLVLPSRYESLSMVLLETWAVSKPVLVNGYCEVLVDQCRRANGGLWYDTQAEFEACLERFAGGIAASVLGRQGYEFVSRVYNRERIDEQYLDLIDLVANRKCEAI
jgi:glycosyltransferase involved in cell wall biosynthesis